MHTCAVYHRTSALSSFARSVNHLRLSAWAGVDHCVIALDRRPALPLDFPGRVSQSRRVTTCYCKRNNS